MVEENVQAGSISTYTRKKFMGYLFLLPAVISFLYFIWYPVVLTFVMSFQKVNLAGATSFVGTENFKTLFFDPVFAKAWANAGEFTILALLMGYLFPVIVAVLINEVRWGQAFFRISVYLPRVAPAVAVSILWLWLFDPSLGLLNIISGWFKLPSSQWLLSSKSALPSLVLLATWAGFGGTAIVYLAGLQGVPEELYEAAEIDGAGIWQRAWSITIPQLKPLMRVMLILQILGTMQVFAEPFIMTGGGPNNATMTILLLIYRYAFTYLDLGVASAASLLLFIVLAILSLIYFKLDNQTA
jgi:multiple sugar transport system permease protein